MWLVGSMARDPYITICGTLQSFEPPWVSSRSERAGNAGLYCISCMFHCISSRYVNHDNVTWMYVLWDYFTVYFHVRQVLQISWDHFTLTHITIYNLFSARAFSTRASVSYLLLFIAIIVKRTECWDECGSGFSGICGAKCPDGWTACTEDYIIGGGGIQYNCFWNWMTSWIKNKIILHSVIIDGLSTEYDRWDPRLNPKWGAQTPVLLDREALVSRWGRNGEVAVWVCPSRSMGVTKTTERVWLPGCWGPVQIMFLVCA